LQLLDPRDIGTRFRELDALAGAAPAVDVVLARVVRGQGVLLVAVFLEEVAEVPGAVADVDLGVVEILDSELRATRVDGDTLGRVLEKLHQPDGAGTRAGVGL